MTIKEQERVIVFKRIITSSSHNEVLYKLKDFSDNELLTILNSTVLPNAISQDNIKYSVLFSMLTSKSNKERNSIQKIFSDIKKLFEALSTSEKDLLKFGMFYGFTSINWKSQMNRYISLSSNPVVGELMSKKKISSYFFETIFPFVYSLIKKGEKNERFPRF